MNELEEIQFLISSFLEDQLDFDNHHCSFEFDSLHDVIPVENHRVDFVDQLFLDELDREIVQILSTE